MTMTNTSYVVVAYFLLACSTFSSDAFVLQQRPFVGTSSAVLGSRLTELSVSLSTTFDYPMPFNSTTTSPPPVYLPKTQQQRKQAAVVQEYRIFCDLDGVLVDFESGIRSLFPDAGERFDLDAVHRKTMWQRVQQADAFFAELSWTESGRRLWNALKPLQPVILTGVPYACQSSRVEKAVWCQREFGLPVHHVDMAGQFGLHLPCSSSSSNTEPAPKEEDNNVCKVITCWSHNKHHESGPGAVLIDDREVLKPAWEAAGGIFVHHDGNMDRTLRQLVELEIIDEVEDSRGGLRP